MGWISDIFFNLFKSAVKIRFEGITEDGRSFSGKTKLEYFGLNEKEINEFLKESLFVESGIRIKEINIIGATESD